MLWPQYKSCSSEFPGEPADAQDIIGTVFSIHLFEQRLLFSCKNNTYFHFYHKHCILLYYYYFFNGKVLTINILTTETKLLWSTSSHPGSSPEEAISLCGSFLTFLYRIQGCNLGNVIFTN